MLVVSDQCGEEIGIESVRVFGTCHMRLKKCGNSRVGVEGFEDTFLASPIWRTGGWEGFLGGSQCLEYDVFLR